MYANIGISKVISREGYGATLKQRFKTVHAKCSQQPSSDFSSRIFHTKILSLEASIKIEYVSLGQ